MFWDNFRSLCIQRGTSPNAVVAELGLSNAICTKWKSGTVPRSDTLIAIAEYFSVPADDLCSEENRFTSVPFSDTFNRLCEERNISVTELSQELGVSRQTIYKWKSGTMPGENAMKILSEYLSVSQEELLGANKKTSDDSEVETVLSIVEKMSIEQIEAVRCGICEMIRMKSMREES